MRFETTLERLLRLLPLTSVVGLAALGCGNQASVSTSGSGSVSLSASAPVPSASASASAEPPERPHVAIDPLSIGRDKEAEKRLGEDIAYLASDELEGRATGYPGADLAAKFLEERYRQLGLLPLGDQDKGSRSFQKRFSADSIAMVGPTELTLSDGDKPVSIEASDVQVLDGSGSGKVDGDAVFVGWGISSRDNDWDDYSGADVTGKVAIALRGPPAIPGHSEKAVYELARFRSKIRAARLHHASALILISQGDELPPPPSNADSVGIPAVVIKRSVARRVLPSLRVDQLTAWNEKQAAPATLLGGVHVHLQTKIEGSGGKPTTDVVAALPAWVGSPTADSWVVVGAHYDHLGYGGNWMSRSPDSHAIHPGADDNASGTSLILEVARRIAALPDKPSRNLAFVSFSGEELGLLGSQAWIDDPPIPLEHVAAMVNADMVGRLRENQVIADDSDGSQRWSPLFAAANGGLDLHFTFGLGKEVGGSDFQSFASADVPVAFLFTGLHDDYHRPTDTADKINLEGEEKIVTFATRLVLELTEKGFR